MRRLRVYPRVCGGTDVGPARPSSRHYLRSIPACAGEPRSIKRAEDRVRSVYPRVCGGTASTCAYGLSISEPVYPRVCGGTLRTSLTRFELNQTGLSPRVRGNPILTTLWRVCSP